MKKAIIYIHAEGVSEKAQKYQRDKAVEKAIRDGYTADEIIEVESAEAIMPCVLTHKIKAVYVYDPARLGQGEKDLLAANDIKLAAVRDQPLINVKNVLKILNDCNKPLSIP